uniref:Uncharacterized protein n=1 Tax=Panagrolaimus sp. JU765 TaxID=591449 RepID=A0AC34RJV6_9BILA
MAYISYSTDIDELTPNTKTSQEVFLIVETNYFNLAKNAFICRTADSKLVICHFLTFSRDVLEKLNEGDVIGLKFPKVQNLEGTDWLNVERFTENCFGIVESTTIRRLFSSEQSLWLHPSEILFERYCGY